jgi:hypothetical protein
MRCCPADINDVARILVDNSVLPFICDDGGAEPDYIRQYASSLLDNVSVYVLMPRVNTLIIFIPTNAVTYDLHVATIKGGGRRFIKQDAHKAVEWMLDNTQVKKFTTMCPRSNPAARIMAMACKMKKEGTITQSWLKDGRLWDIDIFGITSESAREILCQ